PLERLPVQGDDPGHAAGTTAAPDHGQGHGQGGRPGSYLSHAAPFHWFATTSPPEIDDKAGNTVFMSMVGLMIRTEPSQCRKLIVPAECWLPQARLHGC